MATCSSLFSNNHIGGWRPSVQRKDKFNISERYNYITRRNPNEGHQSRICCSAVNIESLQAYVDLSESQLSSYENAGNMNRNVLEAYNSGLKFIPSMILADLDPATAKVAISILGPFLSAFGFLFILRIVMSWYPKLPVGKFPYVLAYAPTEPILFLTRKVIPPVGGVDVTPVVWFGLVSFLNEILVGPQGLLVLLSQQVN
ncbi:protein COFACTOR ASSEMBLY OF COMPLEX C SUBUNIT B CCB3, chloroplastic isoform X2 [Euphorbia lathyris]|uniref:protein COFACTOR ASSEMBLY OF COMPLEX C SUBUNIT B CCB3, chloroplastic isoform X2 n=1 Tax=Euphorbia lathyris TaxID=212925 RepID=UPI003313BE4A